MPANWDMTPYFAEFAGPAYLEFRRELARDVEALRGEVADLGAIEAGNLASWADLLQRLEGATSRSGHLAGYLGCLGAADARDELVAGETASAASARVELEKVYVALRAAVLAVEDELFARLIDDPKLSRVAYFLSRLRERAAWSMTTDLEELSAELDPDGLSAWGRLYSQVAGKLEFDLEVPGREPRRLPVSMVVSLLGDADADVRKAALEGANRAWSGVADVTAACLNAISGTRHTLYARRGVGHFLEPALFDAGITRRTLDVLLDVVTANQELARSYLREKAKLCGKERIGFQDLLAPVPVGNVAPIPWDEARERVLQAFGSFYPKLERFAADAFERRWIDYEPRSGKRPGGFCSSSTLIGESRVFLTYDGSLGDVATLAHELGHAFHSSLMRDMRPWARRYPMTLAETASTFAEQLVIDAVLSNPAAPADERALMLDSRMSDAATFLLNIPMRFQFEKAVYEERQGGELGIGRLKELMLEAQRACYGDALAQDELDPWFWASKLHFYITGTIFYNVPYTFGYLFSMGIFARAKREGPDFLPLYEELLRQTGSDTAEAVAKRSLGVDLEKPDFWQASLDLIEGDFSEFRRVIDQIPQA